MRSAFRSVILCLLMLLALLPAALAQINNPGASTPFHGPFVRLCLFGDSITQHNDTNSNNSSLSAVTYAYDARGWIRWANWLGSQAFPVPPSMDFGVSGNTTVDMLARISTVLAAKPDACFVNGGTNDLTSLGAITTQQTVVNLETIITYLTSRNVLVLWMPITPRNEWGVLNFAQAVVAQEARASINRQVSEWARTQSGVVIVDVNKAMTRQDAFTGTLAAGSTTSVTLPASLTGPSGSVTTNATDSYYKYWKVCLNNGTSLGWCGPISAYVGSTKVASVAIPSTTVSLTTATGPNTITRNDGGSWITDGYQVNAAITTSGFVNSGNNGGGSITGITDSVLTVSRTLTPETATATMRVTTPSASTTFQLDPSGAALDNILGDGLHPNAAGAMLMGQTIVNTTAAVFTPKNVIADGTAGIFNLVNNPYGNILVNPELFGTGGATPSTPFTGTVPRGWLMNTGATYSSTGTFTVGQTARADGNGVTQTITMASVTGGASQEKYIFRQNITPCPSSVVPCDSTFGVGDTLAAACEVSWSGAVGINNLELDWQYPNDGLGNSATASDGYSFDVQNGGLFDQLPASSNGTIQMLTPATTVPDYTGAASPIGRFQLVIDVDATQAAAGIVVNIGRCSLEHVPPGALN